jgi:hypothetical protein
MNLELTHWISMCAKNTVRGEEDSRRTHSQQHEACRVVQRQDICYATKRIKLVKGLRMN